VQIAVTDAEVRHGMLLLRARNVAVLTGQASACNSQAHRVLNL
jgi:hypothetical protein